MTPDDTVILKASRLLTAGSAKRIIDHLLRGEDNDRVTILRGSARDIHDAWQDAHTHGKVRALRLWSLSPAVATSREQALVALEDVAGEFAFDLGRAFIVEHQKRRATADAFDAHWHMAVGEVDPVSGRVLSSSHDHARHEYLARLIEHRLGQPFVLGAHTPAVLARMRREGLTAVADALSRTFEPQIDTERPREAYTTTEHQIAKRKGSDLAHVRLLVAAAWKNSGSLTDLRAALAEVGLETQPGAVVDEWMVQVPGGTPHSLRRLAREKKAYYGLRMRELIDADAERGKRDRDDDPGADRVRSERDRGAAAVRGTDRPAGEGGNRKLHDSDDAPPGPARRGDGGDASTPGGAAPDDHRPARVGGAPLGGHGALIGTATAAGRTAFMLVRRAEASARPALERVEAVLADYEAADKPLRAKPPGLSREHIDILMAARKSASTAAKTVSDEIDAASDRLSSLLIERRRRERLPWSRWLPDRGADGLIAGLEAHRDGLRLQFGTLQTARLRAEVDADAAGRALVVAQAEADRDRDAATQVAQKRLAIIARARKLLLRVPTLAYLGARRLLAMAKRVERTREHGFDPGPGSSPP